MIEQIKQLRLDVDSLHQLVFQEMTFTNGSIPDSFPLYEADKSLLLAKAWLGKVLGELGNENPYKNNGNRHSLEDIESTDAKTEAKQWTGLNHIERVDSIREDIKKVIDSITSLDFYSDLWSKEGELSKEETSEKEEELIKIAGLCDYYSSKSFEHLTEARFHLGFELELIKNRG